MGYESKLYIKRRSEFDTPKGTKIVLADDVMIFDLSKMGYEKVNGKTFHQIFTREIDYPLFSENGTPIYIDCYGEHCKAATIKEVVGWLVQSKTISEYWRAEALVPVLLSIDNCFDGNGELEVVHYGY